MSASTDQTTATDAAAARTAVEHHWQGVWERLGLFTARDDGSAERRYLVTMFPYPSGDLHMGHGEVFALADVLARYWRMRGYDVLFPIGWDSFGLPAENAAIRRGESPAVYTSDNIATQAASIRRYGVSFDWTRRFHTSDPEFYRWNQWIFLRMVEQGLAYRAASSVNWCPQDGTVLANEQVVSGRCERCGTPVVRRDLVQWFFRITDYADRLLDDMALLEGRWPDRVLTMQRNWIGRSTGARVRFAVVGPVPPEGSDDGVPAAREGAAPSDVVVFTTRPDTVPGVTFLAVAPDSDLADRLCAPEQRAAFEAYRELVRAATEIERQATDRPKTGVPLGASVRHPVTGAVVPVWAADYVLPGYGTGVVMGVPAHDERDAAFAQVHGVGVGDASLMPELDPARPGAFDGVAWAEPAVSYRLRDWLLSRQRYWGTPIPIVHCGACGEVPVPDDELPVVLPDLRGADLTPRGVSPLAAASEWVDVPCPRCGGPGRRDTDTMDTFVDSSWYFLRYLSPTFTGGPFDAEDARRWMPAVRYVGGVEHATGHLLYARFMQKVLRDLGLVDDVEPFAAVTNQGQVINEGRAMSKSLGNGVELAEQLDAYGSDAVRLTMVFAGPPEEDIDWADLSPAGAERFLARALRLARDVTSSPGADPAGGSATLRRVTHRTVRDVEGLLEGLRFNVVVARVMELVNAARRTLDGAAGGGRSASGGGRPEAGGGREGDDGGPGDALTGAADPAVREAAEVAAILLSLVAPYTAEEMWAALGRGPSVAAAPWPEVDPALLVESTTVAIVQVDGRVRDRLDVPLDVSDDELLGLAAASPAVERALAGRAVTRTIVRAPGLVNLVTR
ncbi:leucyl-tRNA synthetase [Beutenbergia cavernae DSM 12333]|uniref:Leucine--tRNA ligase n=1 Tax=Beutenbergia cavernae (strain ATCC BAA-8 / DSM 12333 / CCUG 43141 / JCM 11478 / NBRC 16432 / NCIMB 13614 / HKI 0122) TaxID=471853 RepID=C5C5X3_BEUC1|nr:leucine--tRNA ligase [Beutenbergia cavernae]ACQ82331.1 leucyl-tRNA synthetase [Beutenbergia cavernae DSM 12333]